MNNIKKFDSNLLQIDKKSYKSIDIYYNGYITEIDNYENIYCVNLLYLIADTANVSKKKMEVNS